jgi:hypothetical protein
MAIRELSIGQVEVRALPSVDSAFVGAVQELLRQLEVGPISGPAELEALLRIVYPGAVVREQNPLSRLGSTTVWYAYRDGQFSPASEWSV